MGRPNQCNPCCGDITDPPEPPPIDDCDYVICIALIDENDSMAGQSPKMQKWIEAYPNRILFVLDFYAFSSSVDNVYSQEFKDWPYSMSLFLETGAHLSRDNGVIATANSNDPWTRIKNVIATKSAEIQNVFNNLSSQVSVFVDNTGSLGATAVRATKEKLITDFKADGYAERGSVDNKSEDFICPFVQNKCCTNTAAADLMDLCSSVNGFDGSVCDPVSLYLSPRGNTQYLIREYCDDVFNVPDGQYGDVCNSCFPEEEETAQQFLPLTAIALSSTGTEIEGLGFTKEIEYNDSDGEGWLPLNLESTLSDEYLQVGLTGQNEEIDLRLHKFTDVAEAVWSTDSLVDSCSHNFLNANPSDPSQCESYTTTSGSVNCVRKVYNRRFRVKITLVDTPSLTAVSEEFKLFEWFKTSSPCEDYPTNLLGDGGKRLIKRPLLTGDPETSESFCKYNIFPLYEVIEVAGKEGQFFSCEPRAIASPQYQNPLRTIQWKGYEFVIEGRPFSDGFADPAANCIYEEGSVKVWWRRIFDSTSVWLQLGETLTQPLIPSASNFARFGYSVDITMLEHDKERQLYVPAIVIGAPGTGDGDGSVFVYTLDVHVVETSDIVSSLSSGDWVLQTELTPPTDSGSDFGLSVAVSDGTHPERLNDITIVVGYGNFQNKTLSSGPFSNSAKVYGLDFSFSGSRFFPETSITTITERTFITANSFQNASSESDLVLTTVCDQGQYPHKTEVDWQSPVTSVTVSGNGKTIALGEPLYLQSEGGEERVFQNVRNFFPYGYNSFIDARKSNRRWGYRGTVYGNRHSRNIMGRVRMFELSTGKAEPLGSFTYLEVVPYQMNNPSGPSNASSDYVQLWKGGPDTPFYTSSIHNTNEFIPGLYGDDIDILYNIGPISSSVDNHTNYVTRVRVKTGTGINSPNSPLSFIQCPLWGWDISLDWTGRYLAIGSPWHSANIRENTGGFGGGPGGTYDPPAYAPPLDPLSNLEFGPDAYIDGSPGRNSYRGIESLHMPGIVYVFNLSKEMLPNFNGVADVSEISDIGGDGTTISRNWNRVKPPSDGGVFWQGVANYEERGRNIAMPYKSTSYTTIPISYGFSVNFVKGELWPERQPDFINEYNYTIENHLVVGAPTHFSRYTGNFTARGYVDSLTIGNFTNQFEVTPGGDFGFRQLLINQTDNPTSRFGRGKYLSGQAVDIGHNMGVVSAEKSPWGQLLSNTDIQGYTQWSTAKINYDGGFDPFDPSANSNLGYKGIVFPYIRIEFSGTDTHTFPFEGRDWLGQRVSTHIFSRGSCTAPRCNWFKVFWDFDSLPDQQFSPFPVDTNRWTSLIPIVNGVELDDVLGEITYLVNFSDFDTVGASKLANINIGWKLTWQ